MFIYSHISLSKLSKMQIDLSFNSCVLKYCQNINSTSLRLEVFNNSSLRSNYQTEHSIFPGTLIRIPAIRYTNYCSISKQGFDLPCTLLLLYPTNFRFYSVYNKSVTFAYLVTQCNVVKMKLSYIY